jgi:membrane protein YqaA with SNARE-associated domain
LLEGLKEWALELVNNYGQIGLFVVAFAESSFFPIPPDVLIVALVLPPNERKPVYHRLGLHSWKRGRRNRRLGHRSLGRATHP